ncbi:ABC transporter permease [Nocardioides sp. 1609]|uniref:ABC transporter permease n=1 Tax=Nocardioides sp. 1609 TaxID=2508327 RepID=UPI001FD6542F|nr:ABC transporter permease [Nocardioides sp. 1609]
MSTVGDHALFGLGLLVLCCSTLALGRWARLDLGWFPLWALVRATVQLSAIALILSGVLAAPATVAAFLVLMVSTASLTAAGRLKGLRHGRRVAVLGVVVGSAVTLALVLALHLVDLEARYVVAVAGIVIGNTMSAATLTGRHFLHDTRQRRDEVEAWFALGASPSQAHDEIGRTAVREALLPNLDQTKSTGLVTLPGAFVGALFGGADPVEAAQFQLVVLAGLGLAMTTTGVIVARLAGRTPYLPEQDD